MTIYKLDELTLRNVGEEVSDQNRTDWSPLFLNAYNEAYLSLCADVLKPQAGQDMALDSNRRFTLQALEQASGKAMAPAGVLSVKRSRDFSTEASFVLAPEYDFYCAGDGTVTVPAAPALSHVYVVFRCLPETLTNDTPTVPGSGTAPALLPPQYHGALASYAAASFFRMRRKFERMQVWMEAWLSAIGSMQRGEDSQARKIRHVYAPMP